MGLPFLSSQSKKRDQVVAIDLGGRTTKAVHLQRRGEKLALLNYALVEAPAADKAPSPELLAEHLRSVHQALEVGRAVSLPPVFVIPAPPLDFDSPVRSSSA